LAPFLTASDIPLHTHTHPIRFTYGGVIAERVNIVKTRRKVNPLA